VGRDAARRGGSRTPAGVRPLALVDRRQYTYDLTTAANPVANYVFLGVGGAVAVAALLLARFLLQLV